jgi:hypothetical protein
MVRVVFAPGLLADGVTALAVERVVERRLVRFVVCGRGPSVRPVGTCSQALPSACMMKGSVPDSAAWAWASLGGR